MLLRAPCLLVVLVVVSLAAQDSSKVPSAERRAPSPAVTMSFPPVWKPYTAGEAVFANTSSDTQFGANALLGVYRDLADPMYGALGIAGEGYLGGDGGAFSAGARLMVGIPLLFIQGGADYSATANRTDYILSLKFPVNRGGFFHLGGEVRVDWLPTRGQTIDIGVQIPLFQPWVGRTRVYDLKVRVPKAPKHLPPAAASPPDTALDAAIARMQLGARWLARLSFVFWDERGGSYQSGLERTRSDITAFKAELDRRDVLHPAGHSYAAEMALYHGALDRAFALATGDPAVARKAYLAVFDEVIVAYDRHFGQYKAPESLLGFSAIARARFATWLQDSSGVVPLGQTRALQVLDRWLAMLESIRASIDVQSSDDPRLVWLPLQLGLRAEDYDSQEKIDGVIERLVRQRFTRGNAALYVDNAQFQFELGRMILSAEDYHVLWIHDYAGVNAAGQPDSIGWIQSIIYLRALTRRVRDYDRTGRLPVYVIMADAYFTGKDDGGLWLEMLERPLTRSVSLPSGSAGMALAVEAARDSLRAAVAASTRLRAEAAEHGGEDYLAEKVRVYVNLTYPSDLSFRTSHLLGVGFMSDNLMRDHRKIAFRDVTERDPSRGEAIYTGAGVGQQYASATWEDRALLISGPALVTLKARARETLLMNGFAEWELPAFLQPQTTPPDYEAQVERLVAAGATGRAMDVQNRVGFAQKDASISQMALYDLMPPGSVIIVASSIWTSALWAAQLGSAAIRGCHVYVIAPSARNSSAVSRYLLSRQSEILARLLEMSLLLDSEIGAAGGSLRIGIYDRDIDLADVAGGMREVARTYRALPALRAELAVPAALPEYLDAAADTLDARGLTGQRIVGDVEARVPLLHRKTQLFATHSTLAALSAGGALMTAFRNSIVSDVAPRTLAYESVPTYRREERAIVTPLLRGFDALPDSMRARSVLFSAVGSMNKDARGVYLDGEANVLLAGSEALWTWPDYLLVIGWCKWLKSVAEMDSLVPPQSPFTRWSAYKVRRVL